MVNKVTLSKVLCFLKHALLLFLFFFPVFGRKAVTVCVLKFSGFFMSIKLKNGLPLH